MSTIFFEPNGPTPPGINPVAHWPVHSRWRFNSEFVCDASSTVTIPRLHIYEFWVHSVSFHPCYWQLSPWLHSRGPRWDVFTVTNANTWMQCQDALVLGLFHCNFRLLFICTREYCIFVVVSLSVFCSAACKFWVCCACFADSELVRVEVS